MTDQEQDYKEACDLLTETITKAIAKNLETGEVEEVMIDGSILDEGDACTIIGNIVSDYETVSGQVFGEVNGERFEMAMYVA